MRLPIDRSSRSSEIPAFPYTDELVIELQNEKKARAKSLRWILGIPTLAPYWSLRKIDRVTPFYDIFDLLPPVDLMNKVRRMIDQPHGSFAGDTGTAQPIHVGYAEAMEAEVGHLDLDEELLPPPRRLEREFHGEFLFGLGQLFEQGPERSRHRNRKCSVLAPLWRGESDFVLGEIHTVQRDSRFAETAAGVKGELEAGLHASGFSVEG